MRHPVLIALLVATACGEPSPADSPEIELGRRFVDERDFRRAELEASLVSNDNAYARTRLAEYALASGGWDALPEYLPRVSPLRAADFGTFDSDGRRLAAGAAGTAPTVEWTHESLMAAGQWMFESYPMAIDARLAPAIAAPQNAAAIGVWVDREERVGGLVAVEDGAHDAVAWTCATCHTSLDADGAQVAGLSNYAFDSGKLYELGGQPDAVIAAWGAGRVDTSRDATDNAAVISDLRAVRYQPYLHHTATLRNGLVSLAVRVETLLIVSQGQRRRPPRDLAFAMAYYLWHLGEGRPSPPSEGVELFEANCGRCHHADGTTVGAVAPEEVGTEPTLADAPGRGTGLYRVPSLVGVRDRALLMHDGSVAGLDDLFDPDRLAAGAHPFGLELDADARSRLRAFVSGL